MSLRDRVFKCFMASLTTYAHKCWTLACVRHTCSFGAMSFMCGQEQQPIKSCWGCVSTYICPGSSGGGTDRATWWFLPGEMLTFRWMRWLFVSNHISLYCLLFNMSPRGAVCVHLIPQLQVDLPPLRYRDVIATLSQRYHTAITMLSRRHRNVTMTLWQRYQDAIIPLSRHYCNAITTLSWRYRNVIITLLQHYDGIIVTLSRHYCDVTTTLSWRYHDAITPLSWRYCDVITTVTGLLLLLLFALYVGRNNSQTWLWQHESEVFCLSDPTLSHLLWRYCSV